MNNNLIFKKSLFSALTALVKVSNDLLVAADPDLYSI